jgi:biotin transporter BioY
MYIVAIAWIYVVFMMSITEQSIIAGIMTFLLYGVLPLSVILYLAGARQRKNKRRRNQLDSEKPQPPSAVSPDTHTKSET